MTTDGHGVAVITGASHGIARAAAFRLAERGWAVRGIGLGAKDLEQEARGLDVEVVEGDDEASTVSGTELRMNDWPALWG